MFNFQINYNKSCSGVVDPLYNGNIAETYWKTSNDNTMRRYAYSYDALNRITSGKFNGSGQTDRYTVEGITYDKNGNIEHLTRRGHVNSGATSFGVMDNLAYTYDTGNKLLKVTDSGNKTYGFKDGTNTGNDYTYDANGNLLTDANKGITGISYNHLNLPTQVSFGSNKIAYIYDASGAKLKKEVTQGSSVTATEYANGYIYENGQLQFFSHPEGYVTKENNTFKYVYQYRDHLGNVRLSYSNTGTTSAPQLEIVEENNFYPFGLKHKGYNEGISPIGNSVAQKWKYNGQEYNESLGLNTIEMTFRQYDPATGRFNVIDAASELAQNWTPYRFGFNNPILFSDPLGLWEIRNGNWYTDDKKDIQRFLDMVSMEDAFNGGASIAQIDKFVGEEFRGSGGRLSDGSILLDGESVAIDKSGKASDLSPRQVDHIQNQVSTYGSHWWNEKSSSYNNPWYTYKYYRERSWEQNGGSFPGIALGSYAAGQVSNFLYNNEGWFSLTQAKRYGHGFHGNQFTERRVTIGNLSKWINTGGKMLGAYGVYSTYNEWSQGKLTNLGAAYIGGVDAAALARGNVYLTGWSFGTGLGKGVVESNWYFNAVHNAPNW
ncbi:RHS repeat-associated core domain-containing protein [Sinomicrobium oceani]|uniref:RHS repeat-associated core domain-containing protein n=1 Tax=Sinomicrobium oceani TaxID=1150368 RepID=A0A1K1R8U3_9FLAO|nr:RHS repeat-associated core domain-containing protein [Sinomicrobium oceani]